MNILQWTQQLPAILQAIIGFLVALVIVATTLSAFFKLFGWQRGVDYMSSLGIDIGKLIALLQGFQPVNKAVVQTTDIPKAIDFKIPGDGVVKFGCIFALSCLAGLSQTACGGSLHSTIETIMVFQAEVHTEQAQVLLAANAAIATLPPTDQQAALAALNSANDKLTAALNTKDAALQAALDASDASGINIQQIEQDIMIAVNAVVSLIQTFGVTEQTQRAQAAATRLLAARSPAVNK